MMSASSDVERELAMLKGEITASAPKQLEGSAANGGSQNAQQAPPAQQPGPYAPPAPQQYTPPQVEPPTDQVQQPSQAQPAGLPVADMPGLADEPQDGDRS
jgi:hypothetical protein